MILSQTTLNPPIVEPESAACLSPKDPTPLILDLLGHKASTLKAIDSTLSTPPQGKVLQGKERGDARVNKRR
ncbi:hypothetical protein LINPERPRIM_LOCUS21771 [Linum perenne]